jgi:branched-chain amino acid transport system permease protein
MNRNNLILYIGILIFGVLAAPFILPAFKVQLSILCVLIVLALPLGISKVVKWVTTLLEIFFFMV